MLEYLNFILLAAQFSVVIYAYHRIKKYLPLIKIMSDILIDSLMTYDVPQQDVDKKQKLLECVLTGNSKLYLGKVYTEEQINKLDIEEIEKLFTLYEAKLSGQMVKSLGKSIIHMYSMGACAAFGINNQDVLSDDLENDPFLNSALQKFTCELYYRFGSFLAPVSVGLITGRHYIKEKNILDNKNDGGTNNSSNDEESEKS